MSQQDTQFLEDFDWFRDRICKFSIAYSTYLALYDSDEATRQLLRRSAVLFFDDLHDWLAATVILHACGLTDPAKQKKSQNLTADHFLKHLEANGIRSPEAKARYDELMSFRAKIVPVRHKIIAHLDLDTFRKQTLLGEHSEDEMRKFLNSLIAFSDEVGMALGVGPVDLRCPPGDGDVHSLIHNLKIALHGVYED